ncbi:hypothetical protein [Streptomyces brevispora]|uniref:hypothetical protein n=1 Tax=Streptomyces brevispora TaxID=887462 RepID=UPI0038165E6F
MNAHDITSEKSAELLPEQRFNQLKDRLSAATGSLGLTSFHGGKVHMTLGEWERLIYRIEAADAASDTQTAEMHARELHHFEEEQISAGLRAVVEKALIVPTTDGSALRTTHTILSEGLDGSASTKAFFQEHIRDAVSQAANGVSDLAPENEQVRDAANLIDSAAQYYLQNPGATLRQAIQASYDQDVDDVLSWIQD